MRIGVLTSTDSRHRHFVHRVAKRFDVVAVVIEDTGYSPAETDDFGLTDAEQRIVEHHYAERTRQEAIMCAAKGTGDEIPPGIATRHVAKSELNTDQSMAFLTNAGVEIVLVYGTDLIRPPLLGAFDGRMVNMHLGLSPYYRGTATNFYPLLNEEPEYVGATIHVIDAGIDSGAILAHARPEIVVDDGPHSIGCKAIDAGIDALIRVLPEWFAGKRRPVPQWEVPNARLYQRKDFHPRHVVELHKKIEDGLIRRYVERAVQVTRRVRLIT